MEGNKGVVDCKERVMLEGEVWGGGGVGGKGERGVVERASHYHSIFFSPERKGGWGGVEEDEERVGGEGGERTGEGTGVGGGWGRSGKHGVS